MGPAPGDPSPSPSTRPLAAHTTEVQGRTVAYAWGLVGTHKGADSRNPLFRDCKERV
jgi:hypothetical protein